MAQYIEQQRCNKQARPVQELVSSRPAIKPNETCTIVIDDDDDVADVSCNDVSTSLGACASKPSDRITLSNKPDVQVISQDNNNVSITDYY